VPAHWLRRGLRNAAYSDLGLIVPQFSDREHGSGGTMFVSGLG